MNVEPQKFFIGLMDFFSILLPGALLTCLLREMQVRASLAMATGWLSHKGSMLAGLVGLTTSAFPRGQARVARAVVRSLVRQNLGGRTRGDSDDYRDLAGLKHLGLKRLFERGH